MCVRLVHVRKVELQWRKRGIIWPLSTPNNFVVYGQKQSIGIPSLSQDEWNTLKPKLSSFGEILQQNLIL